MLFYGIIKHFIGFIKQTCSSGLYGLLKGICLIMQIM